MTKNTVEPEVHIEIPMALAPIPADPDRREWNESKITTAAKAAMAGGAPLRGPLEVSISMSYAAVYIDETRTRLADYRADDVGSRAVHSPAFARDLLCERRTNCKAYDYEVIRREALDGDHDQAACRMR
jgi:hypothetical protein